MRNGVAEIELPPEAGSGTLKRAPRVAVFRDLGRVEYGAAFELQRALVEERKRG